MRVLVVVATVVCVAVLVVVNVLRVCADVVVGVARVVQLGVVGARREFCGLGAEPVRVAEEGTLEGGAAAPAAGSLGHTGVGVVVGWEECVSE